MSDIHESLSDKLRSLGVQTGPRNISPPVKKHVDIEDVVSGTFMETNFGPIFCSESKSGNVYTHGSVQFISEPIHRELVRWADPTFSNDSIDLESILFLDTETTGLSGGTGTIPFMVGIGRFVGNEFVTFQTFLRNPAEERAQLDLLNRFFDNAKVIATYNGKSFDIPILNTRYVLNGLPSPFKNLGHVDLLSLSRRLWKRRLENRTLKDIETEILNFERNQMEVPGWEVPILYFNYLRTGDPAPMAGVFYHNAVDVQSLAALLLYMNRMVVQPESNPELLPVDLLSLAIQFESTGENVRAIALYEQLLSSELLEPHATELRLRYARILKRNGDYIKTVSVLDSEHQEMDIQRIIQLAKVLEHQQKDIYTALEWTEKALHILEENSQEQLSSQPVKNDLLKRRDRLVRKIGSSNAQT